jgi:hypothetical protein
MASNGQSKFVIKKYVLNKGLHFLTHIGGLLRYAERFKDNSEGSLPLSGMTPYRLVVSRPRTFQEIER